MPTTSVRRRISLLSRSSELLLQSWRQCSFGKPVKASRSGPASSRSAAASGKRVCELGDDPGVLVVHGGGVGLGEDRAHHRRDEALRALGDARQEVAHEVAAAALPSGARERGGDRVDQAGVRVGADQLHAGEAARDQAAHEREPSGPVLGGDHIEPERLAEAVPVDPDRVDDADVDRAAALTALHHQRVERHVRIRRAVERPSTELLDDPIE